MSASATTLLTKNIGTLLVASKKSFLLNGLKSTLPCTLNTIAKLPFHCMDKSNMIHNLETELNIGENDPVRGQTKKNVQVESQEVAASTKKPKEKKPKAPKPAAAVVDQPEVTKLDIRVGKIIKAWKHEEADKLYCEEIDVGEETVRQIASGLVPHYTLEQMQNRHCLVLCNLKARNLVGFKSHGMVVCAAKTMEDGHEKVEFVEPPSDAKVGERVYFEGLEGEPFTPAQVEKKKVFQNSAPDLKTDGNRNATWKEHIFMTSAGPCTVPTIENGVVR